MYIIGSKIYLSYNYGQSWQASNSITHSWLGVAVSDNGGVIFGADYGNSDASGTGAGIFKSVTAPTSQPSMQPSYQPSRQPSSQPSRQPSVQPSSSPSYYTAGNLLPLTHKELT